MTAVLLVALPTTPVAAAPSRPQAESLAPLEHLLEIANDVLERRTSALVSSGGVANSSTTIRALSNDTVRESSALLAAEQRSLTELTARRDALREWGEAYTYSETELTTLHVTTTPTTITLDVEEYTKLYYARIHGDEPDFTAWVAPRRFVFAATASGWELTEEHLLSRDGIPPANEPTGASARDMRSALSSLPRRPTIGAIDSDRSTSIAGSVDTTGDVGIMATFDRAAAAAYARKYWKNYNTAYRNFNNSGNQGGDCTNFVSQAMRAGGWTDKSGFYRDPKHWWYNSLNQTWSWIGVGYWYEFAAVHSQRTAILSSPLSLFVGEVLQADFTNNGTKDHSMIVTTRSTSGSTMIYLTYHSTDTLDRSFANISSSYPNARWLPHLVKTTF